MNRRTFVGGLTLCTLAAPLPAAAQPAERIRQIGFLGTSSRSAIRHLLDTFQQSLRERGYVEGQNIHTEWRFAESRLERLPDLAVELVRLRVDIIIATITPAALAAKNATQTIPIVTVLVPDPVESGLAASLGRPGGNVTGLTFFPGPEIMGKHLELLKQAVPKVARVAVLWNPILSAHPMMLRETEGAARAFQVSLQRVAARTPNEFADAFEAMVRERADALIVLGDPMHAAHRVQLLDLAAKTRLPAIYATREYVVAGGLMAYGASTSDLFRRAATYVDRIFKGANPADLPFEQPTKFELVINLKTARALGLTIPPALLLRADHVIE